MKYTKHCDCCGNIVTAYTHHINVPLVRALRQLVDFYDKNRIPCNLQKHLTLTKNQYNNFQKLQYWGLVYRDEKGWFPTMKGTDFIAGGIDIPNIVATFGKEILGDLHEAWNTHKSKRFLVSVEQIDEVSYKKREDYKEEKTANMFNI